MKIALITGASRGIGRSAALQLAARNIAVVVTYLQGKDQASALDKNPEFAQALANETALGRVGEPDDVGKVVAALLSEDGNWINAQRIEVAGGFYI